MVVEVLRVDAEIPVKEEQQLLLHKVDLCDGESKVLVAADSAVPGPVLVLGRGVIEVLGCKTVHRMPLATGGRRDRNRLR